MKDEIKETASHKNVKVTSSILDAFDLLRGSKDDVKLAGAAQIVSKVENSEGGTELQYALKRLVRSLGANVPEARSGYFATLVTLLTVHVGTTVTQLLELVKKELHASGGTKSEVGDVALGQILVCGAVFRSGLMLKSSQEEQSAIIQMLLAASKKKSYLGTVAYLILLDFIDALPEDQFASIIWPHLKPELKREVKEQTLDSLHALLVTSTKFPSKVKLHKLIGTQELICEDNIQDICDKIMGGIELSTVTHPIYSAIGALAAKSSHALEFWRAIDAHLLKHNRNREVVALNILHVMLENVQDGQIIPELLTRNFFKLFMDWFRGLQTASKIRNKRENEDDNKLMIKKQKEIINTLTKVLKSDKANSKIIVEALEKLLFNPGEINFSEITGTSIVKSIMADLDRDGVKKMAKQLKGVLLNSTQKQIKEGVARSWYNNERVRAADLIAYLVNHESVKDDTNFKLTYMKVLMCFGFFKISGDQDMAVSHELSGAIKACFYRCFTSRYSNVDHLVTVLSSLCTFICSILEKEQIRHKMEKQFPKENMECWQMLTGVCQEIEKNDSKSKVEKVFLILLYQLGLFLFSEPTYVKMAQDSIKELKSCYDHYRKSKKKTNGHLSDEPEWIEVLIEVLLSILSAESSVLRSVVQCVFRLLWEDLTPSAVGQIVSVLDPDSETNPLTNESDSEGDDDEKSADEEESDENEKGSDDNLENEDESDSGSDDEDDDAEMKTPDQLRMAVQKALGAAADSDNESLDADMIDEQEGKKLDEALAEAFKQFHQGKGKKNKKERKDKKALSDFRIRVLDLIDIYLEKDPSMDICLGMIGPLTRCLESCILDPQFTELGNRVRKTLKLLAKIRKFTSIEDVNIDTLCDCLKATIEKNNRSHFLYQALGDVITHLATFIIHCSQKIATNTTKSQKKQCSPLLDIFKEALRSYFHNRNCLLPIIFFHNILQIEWEGTYDLVPILIENVFNKDVRQFRRSEGLELIGGFYRALKRIKPSSNKLLKKLSKLEDNFDNTLKKSLSEGFEAKSNFFVGLKKLINVIRMFHESCHVESSLDFKVLLETVASCKGTAKVNSSLSNTQQVAEAQNLQNKKSKKKKSRKRKQLLVNGHTELQAKKIRKDSNQSE